MFSLSIIWKQTVCVRYINQHIANCTALRRPCYMFKTTSYRQSTLMEGQYWFYSTPVWHLTRLNTLESTFGIQGNVMGWFQSYFTDRNQTVHIKKCTPEPHELKYVICSGSHTIHHLHHTPGKPIRGHGLTVHLNEDDTKLQLAIKPSEPLSINDSVSQIEKRVNDILNNDKTELLVITSRPSRSQSLDVSIKFGDQYISPSDNPPKKLGVFLMQNADSAIMLLMCEER